MNGLAPVADAGIVRWSPGDSLSVARAKCSVITDAINFFRLPFFIGGTLGRFAKARKVFCKYSCFVALGDSLHRFVAERIAPQRPEPLTRHSGRGAEGAGKSAHGKIGAGAVA